MIHITKQEKVVLCVLFCVFIAGLGLKFVPWFSNNAQSETQIVKAKEHKNNDTSPVKGVCSVSIQGEVCYPGTYVLQKEDRLIDLINKAVPTVNADIDSLDVTAHFTGDSLIIVKSKSNKHKNNADNTKININSAGIGALQRLDGVGKTIAQRIVSYRSHTVFRSIEDIKKVKGIGDKKYSSVKDAISVE